MVRHVAVHLGLGGAVLAALVGSFLCYAFQQPTCPRVSLKMDQGHQTCSTKNRPSPTETGMSRQSAIRQIGQGMASAVAAMSIPKDPAYALFEDFRKEGGCPQYEEIKSPSVDDFDVNKYMGIWYEMAYHDWTQYSVCGCTRFNMTRWGNTVEDIFTTKCPQGNPKGGTYVVNMSMAINPAARGVMIETAFGRQWPNMVLDVWKDSSPKGDLRYSKAIQLQCVEVKGKKAFVGINFLSRRPLIPASELQDMWDHAQQLGLSPYGGNREEMVVVNHNQCLYPITTDSALITKKERFSSLGGALGVKVLDSSLLVSPG